VALANGDFLDFNGRLVLMTGAATGIGRAVAVAFASHGAKVAVADINEAAATETLDLIERAGSDVLFVRTNVAEEADVEKFVSAALSRFGRLDFAFNNALYQPRAAANGATRGLCIRPRDLC
jgi:NAD(P)-dependent dehydrogenase (short-subunit alcohol dehydrogenase family)